MERLTKLAGVTFNNDDGTSRQEILKGILTAKPYGLTMATLVPCKFMRDGVAEDAIKVLTRTNKGLQCVGWIPKTDIALCKGLTEVLMSVSNTVLDGNTEPTCFAALYVHEDPSKAQYAYARKKGIKGIPYDKAAYSLALDFESVK